MQETERDAMRISDETAVVAMAALLQKASASRATARAAAMAPAQALPFLQPGRLVRILTEGDGLAVPPAMAQSPEPVALLDADGGGLAAESGQWGIIVNFERLGKKGEKETQSPLSNSYAGVRAFSSTLNALSDRSGS